MIKNNKKIPQDKNHKDFPKIKIIKPEPLAETPPPNSTDPSKKNDRYTSLPIPRDAFPIKITESISIFVDKTSGEILGPKAEGTLGIILYGAETRSKGSRNRYEVEKAIRIPRLLNSDVLLNFHIAEICNYEGKQSQRFDNRTGLLGANFFHRLQYPNIYRKSPETKEGCYLGFYLSPTSKYKACLLSEKAAWPQEFSEFLKNKEKAPSELYQEIKKMIDSGTIAEDDGDKPFDNLIYFPDCQVDDHNDERVLKPMVFSRERIHHNFAKRKVSGWWFNLPISIFSWMTADLERLITSCLESQKHGTSTENATEILGWEIHDWFELFSVLAEGFYILHTGGAIHGDARPANIMTKIPFNGRILPRSFCWIDIGLGYEELPAPQNEMGKTSITPRPMGGGRTTPFYAPERVEGVEYEDSDHISLERYMGNLFLLKFYFKQKTDHRLEELRLQMNGKPLRELGSLHRGDRIQIREFLFLVEKVEESGIIVSRIYEIAMDKVLIDRSFNEESSELILSSLKSASISRYRIFKQWSQATDIFGLGNTILYLIFIRGLLNRKQQNKQSSKPNAVQMNEDGISNTEIKEKAEEKEAKSFKNNKDEHRNSFDDRSHRDSIFLDLSLMMRSKTFITYTLMSLNKINGENDILDRKLLNIEVDLDSPERTHKSGNPPNLSTTLSDATKFILSTDSNFSYILSGLDYNIGLFIQVIYFCLCCLWRKDEWEEVNSSNDFEFEPFCESRLKIDREKEQGTPAERAMRYLKELGKNISSLDRIESKTIGEKYDRSSYLQKRDEQVTTQASKIADQEKIIGNLMNEIQEFKQIIESHGKEKSEQQDYIKGMNKEIQNLKTSLEVQGNENKSQRAQIERLQAKEIRLKEIFTVIMMDQKISKKIESRKPELLTHLRNAIK